MFWQQLNNTKNCRNCKQPLDGAFCKTCGQRAKIERLSLRHAFKDASRFLLNIEGPFMATNKAMIFHPGRFIKSFIAGERKGKYRPIGYFLLWLIVYFIFFRAMNIDFSNSGGMNLEEMPAQMQKVMTVYLDFMNRYMKHLTFLQVPIMAFFTYLFFGKSRMNYAEHLAANFYLGAMALVFGTISLPLFKLVSIGKMSLIAFGITTVYNVYSLGDLFSLAGYTKRSARLRAFFATFIQYIVFIFVYAVIALLYAVLYVYFTRGFASA